MPVPRGSPHPCAHRQGDLCLSYDITWMESRGSRSSAEPGFSHPTERPWSPRLWLHPRGRTISRVPGGPPWPAQIFGPSVSTPSVGALLRLIIFSVLKIVLNDSSSR